MRVKEVQIPIYFGKLIMILTDDYREVDEAYGTKINDEDYEAVFFGIEEKDHYIVAIKRVSWSVIAHEVVHIVNGIFLSCGIELDRNNDEPQAYLTGWIVNEIDEFLKEK